MVIRGIFNKIAAGGDHLEFWTNSWSKRRNLTGCFLCSNVGLDWIQTGCLRLEQATALCGYSFDKDAWTPAVGEQFVSH